MRFIWDDIGWKLVSHKRAYDENQFVVVRKLHVKLNTDSDSTLPIQGFSVDLIRQHSERFGNIESIEMLPNKETEAHVTFVSDRSAYSMQSQHEFDKEARRKQQFQIQPADTWEQPRENTNPLPKEDLEQTSEIFMLNEDCLLHLFMFLDVGSLVDMADVCKLFNRLLHRYCFPRIRKFEVINSYIPYTFFMPLAKMHRVLRCVGPYITDLIFECNVDEWEIKHDVVTRFLEVLAENVGTNIRRAWISCRTICKNDRISKLAPIFRHLELLQLKANNYTFDIDFHTMCPNLVDIQVDVNVPMRGCVKPWKSLRRLAIINSSINTADLIKLIALNPQLTHIEFKDDLNGNISLPISNLRMLENVQIASTHYNHGHLNGFKIACLSRLQHLTEISLFRLRRDSMEGILDCLATFVGLRKICLHQEEEAERVAVSAVDPRSLRSLVKLATKQPKLEELKLDSVKLTRTALMEFVRYAIQLKKLQLKWSGLMISDQLILNLVDVLKFNRSEPNDVLVLELYSYQLENLNVIKTQSVSRYLQVKPI
ncbi:uncharacterized protein LOC129569487 [Sitodiplosis mosellana]|uniref:uncharacterized protein LOC129569487 n=1 Tax=Sitodiplosis mosellana TaxID=263140 RepID=UPI002443AF7C|nr:uncharacterized protein LOC129569487 [Sitodiplosis mosellana]